VRHASMRTKSSQERQISYFEGSAGPSTTEGVPSTFQLSSLTGCRRDCSTFTGAFFRVEPETVRVDETRNVRGGNRRNGKGSSSPQGAGSREFRQRGSGKPGLAVDMSADHSASEPPRARPPKQATVNSRAHVSVWIQAARTALGLERPTPSRLMHDSFRSRDERDRKS
jgi:hypothetical protein